MADHKRRMLGGHSSPRFDEEVLNCEPPRTERSNSFDGSGTTVYYTDVEAEKVAKEQLIIGEVVRLKV